MARSSTANAKPQQQPDNGLQEVEIVFDGESYLVRPEYRLLARVQRMTGKSPRDWGIEAYASTLSYGMREAQGLKDIGIDGTAQVLAAVLFDKLPKPLTSDQIGEILVEKGGYADYGEPIANLLYRHIRGNEAYEREQREKAKEGAATKADQNPQKEAAE
jgi:hypothetical protein